MFSLDKHLIKLILCALLIAPLLAHAQSLTPLDPRDGASLKTDAGFIEGSKELAEKYCKSLGPLIQSAKLIEEKWMVFGTTRFYKCSYASNLSSEKRPTSIEQKTMQSRKVNKKIDDVVKGVNEWLKNSGYKGVVTENGGRAQLNSKGHVLVINISFTKLSDKATVIRLRTFDGIAGAGGLALTNPDDEFFDTNTYQYLFNQIGQELFTQTLNLEPPELN